MEFINQIRNSQRLDKWEIRPIEVALFLCLILAFAYAATGLLAGAYAYFSGRETDIESLPFLIVSGFGFQFGCVIAWIAFRVIVPYENRIRADPFSRSLLVGIIGFVIVYLAIIPTMLIWKSALEALNFEYEVQLPVQLVQNGGTFLEMTFMSLLVVVAAPISEELVYRGFIFRYLNNRLPSAFAISITAALFALMHQNLYSFAPLFVLGAALCVVYRMTGNIVSSIAMHACFNLLNLVLMTYFGPLEA